MKKISLFIVVCLASCHTPRQLVSPVTVEKIVTVHDTVEVAAPVPETVVSDSFLIDWDGGSFLDSLTVEDSTSSATVVATGDVKAKKRSYKITSTRKVDTIRIVVPVTIRDTIRIECPPVLPPIDSGGKFPWWWLIAAFGAISVWWVGQKRKK